MRPLDPRLLRYARSARRHIAVIALLGTLTAALVITQALLISAALSPVVEGTATLGDVTAWLWVLAAIVILRAASVALREALSHRAAENAVRELRSAVIDRAVELGPRWRARHGTDTTTLLTRGLSDLVPYFVRFLPQLILVCTVTPLALLTILILDFWSALVAALTVPLIPIFMALIGRFTQESSAARLVSMQQLGSQLLDLLAGLPTLRALGRQDAPKDHLAKLGAQNTKVTMTTLRVAFLSGGVLEFLATLSVALVAVEVGMRLVYGNISLFAGLAVIMLAPEVFEPLRQVGAQFHASANGVAAANSAFEITETPSTTATSTPNGPDKTCPDLRHASIRLVNLSIAARKTWAPHDLTATIEPGRITALVGPSGAGKSTTVAALLGIEGITRGHIFFGDTDASNVSRDSVWNQVVWIPQIPVILPGTLADNLPTVADADRLTQAAKATGFDQVLESLPAGWETRVGHGGVGLSVGQRQRLSLLRAMLSDAPLVILDEPTAHLDAATEEIIIKTLRQLRDDVRTVLVIAHRQALLSIADARIQVTSQEASAEDCQQWPELELIEAAPEYDFDLPELLDAQEAKK